MGNTRNEGGSRGKNDNFNNAKKKQKKKNNNNNKLSKIKMKIYNNKKNIKIMRIKI